MEEDSGSRERSVENKNVKNVKTCTSMDARGNGGKQLKRIFLSCLVSPGVWA